jgi:alpha-glucosidase
MAVPWWQSGVLYQIYPRSFADSNGDGIGDLRGVLDRLDHLERLGVDGIWFSPITVSPQADFGYDVADYRDVDPAYGDLATLDELIAQCDRRGMYVLLDLVPNHSSSRHPWFVDALSSRDSTYRDYYVWADPKPDGTPPNNWVGCFGGPAWTLDEASGQYYLHNFLPEQPDLNWWNEKVRNEFDDIVRFWWDRGIAGFRIDVCHMMIKDAELRDNPPAGPEDPFVEQMFGQKPVYNSNRPEAHDILRRWRKMADTYDPGRVLIGETNVTGLDTLLRFYGTGTDELCLAFDFEFIEAPFEEAGLRGQVEALEAALPAAAWPVWTGSNHDVSRLATHWGEGRADRTRLALLMLLTLRGTPVLYQGDEIGLIDGDVTREELADPVGLRFWPHYKGRDPERTPMPWTSVAPGHGFTTGTPWLSVSTPPDCNVAAQEADPSSVLAFTRAAIALRRATDDLALGTYTSLDAPEGVWLFRRGTGATVALNMSDAAVEVDGVSGKVALRTTPPFTSDPAVAVDGSLLLDPWSGAVVLH